MYFTFWHVIMPSSEVTTGHNPSRISIDNGTYVQNTKNSQRYEMSTNNTSRANRNYNFVFFSDECSKFIRNQVDGLRIFEVHQVSFMKCIHVNTVFYQTPSCVVIFVQIGYIIPVYLVVWVSLQVIIKTVVCVTSFDGIFMFSISALLILTFSPMHVKLQLLQILI